MPGTRRNAPSVRVHYALFQAEPLLAGNDTTPRIQGSTHKPRRADDFRLGTIPDQSQRHNVELLVSERGRQQPEVQSCPWCEATDVRFVQRGYTGLTDEVDQYLVCNSCGKTTYQLIAKTAREMRLGRYKPGDIYQDRQQNTRYTINRVLRVGQNEFLIYLKPLSERPSTVG